MIMTNLLVMMVCGTIVAVYALIVRDPLRIAEFSRRVALSLVLGFAVIATLFVSGYAFEDPGGVEAWVMTGLWVLPMIGISLWAWFSPRVVEPVMWVLTAAIVAMSFWWFLAPQTWQRFMDERGPVTAIAALAVGVCLAVWGYHRPGRAAIGLIAIAVSPLIGAVLTADAGHAMAGTSTVVAVSPFLTCAVLYLLSASAESPGEANGRSVDRMTFTRLVGVYRADGGVRGELRYLAGHYLHGQICSLCDITHSPFRRKAAWDAGVAELGIPFDLLHLNELEPGLADVRGRRRRHGDRRAPTGRVTLLDNSELTALHGDVPGFFAELRTRLAAT